MLDPQDQEESFTARAAVTGVTGRVGVAHNDAGLGFRTGLSWREAKGKRAINQDECSKLYSELWDQYIDENPELIQVLLSASSLSDRFGQIGHCCQATELWRIRSEYQKCP